MGLSRNKVAGSGGVAVEVPGGGGQIRIVPREQLELNLSADSQALAFDTTELSLTSLSEDSEPVTVVFPVNNVSSRTLYLANGRIQCSDFIFVHKILRSKHEHLFVSVFNSNPNALLCQYVFVIWGNSGEPPGKCVFIINGSLVYCQ